MLFKPSALFTAFAVSVIILEIAVLLLLRSLKSGSPTGEFPIGLFGQSFLFLLLTWGVTSIAFDVNNALITPNSEKTFFSAVLSAPFTYLAAPFIFIGGFFVIYMLQTGIVYLFTLSKLPIWVFPALYIVLFFTFVFNILVVLAVLFYFFLWVPHTERMGGSPRKLAMQFYTMISERAFKAFSQAALWLVLTILVFWFIFFPVWKIAVKRALDSSSLVMGTRLELEVIGKDNLLADCVAVISDDSILPSSFANNLATRLNANTNTSPIDRYGIKRIPSAGYLFIAALMLSFAFPVTLAIALFCAGGSYSYLLVLGPERKQAVAASTIVEERQAPESNPQPKPQQHAKEEDTFVEDIEPDVFEFMPTAATGEPLKKREKLEEFVDFDYVHRNGDESSAAAGTTGFFRGGADKMPDADPKTNGTNRKLRNPVAQTKPERKDEPDMGNFTIFDMISDEDGKADKPKK